MEFLKEYLGEELYNQVAEKLKDAKTADGKPVKLADLSTGEYVAKKKFTDEQDKVTALTTERDKLDDDLKALKKLKPEDLQKQIDTLTTERDTQKTEYDNQIAAINKKNATMDKIRTTKPRDAEDVYRMMDHDKISLDGENLLGFEDQINGLQENKKYLWPEEEPGDTGGGGNPANRKGADTKAVDSEKFYGGLFK